MTIRVAVALGADPLHLGHLLHIREARKLGDYLIAITGPDEFLISKKGYCLLPLEDRMELLKSLREVDGVVVAVDKDGTVAETLRKIKPDIFCKGGDRTANAMPENEIKACEEIGCKIIYGVGKQLNSSSLLVQNACLRIMGLGGWVDD